jgi:hypothetical protein
VGSMGGRLTGGMQDSVHMAGACLWTECYCVSQEGAICRAICRAIVKACGGIRHFLEIFGTAFGDQMVPGLRVAQFADHGRMRIPEYEAGPVAFPARRIHFPRSSTFTRAMIGTPGLGVH